MHCLNISRKGLQVYDRSSNVFIVKKQRENT